MILTMRNSRDQSLAGPRNRLSKDRFLRGFTIKALAHVLGHLLKATMYDVAHMNEKRLSAIFPPNEPALPFASDRLSEAS